VTTVAEVIGVSRSNPMERLRARPKKRIGRRPLPDGKLVAETQMLPVAIATRGSDREHALVDALRLARYVAQQHVSCGRKPSDAHHLGFTQPRALGARSAMNSRSHSAAGIIVRCIAHARGRSALT